MGRRPPAARPAARREAALSTRLLILVTHPMTARILMRGQLAYLARAGFEVAVAAAPGPDLDAVAKQEGVAVFPLPFTRRSSPLRDLVALARTIALLRHLKPHIVNAGTPKAGLLGMLAARLCRVPVRLYTVRGLRLETTHGLARRLLSFLERRTAAAAHRVVFVSDSLCARYVGLGLAPAGRSVVLAAGSSNGVDTGRFRPAAAGEAAALRRRLAIPEDALVVGFVGRWTRDKGIEDLAEVFASSLVARHPACRLLLLGDWEEGDPVAQAVRSSLAADPRVIRPGFVPDPETYYRVMDVLAFPSYREGLPNAPLEAAASAVPVVGYATTGTVDAVAEGETGTLVPLGNRQRLADALLAFLDDAGLRADIGRAGRERVMRCFSRERVWQAWTDLYRQALAGEPSTCGGRRRTGEPGGDDGD